MGTWAWDKMDNDSLINEFKKTLSDSEYGLVWKSIGGWFKIKLFLVIKYILMRKSLNKNQCYKIWFDSDICILISIYVI